MTTSPRLMGRKCSLLWLLLLAGLTSSSRAADGAWGSDADGDWNTAGNWLNSTIADGAGATAFFTNDITAPRTVSLTSPRTIGNLRFADSDPNSPAGWILSDGGTAANTLTLSGTETPVITVDAMNGSNGSDSTNDVIVNGVLTSPQGFVKRGPGTLTLVVTNNFNSSVQLDEGIVAIGSLSAMGNSNRGVIYNGGGIRLWNGGPAFANTNIVLTTGHIVSSNGNYDALNGPWIGSGTMYIHATGRLTPGGGVASSFLGFSGTISLADSTSGNETRINLGGSSVALYDLSTVTLDTGSNGGRFSFRTAVAPATVRIGALRGGPGTRLMSSEQSAGTSLIWEVGYLNTSTTFEGTIQNRNTDASRVGNLTKVGTGTLTLLGTSTYTGNTVVSNGVLALGATGVLANSPSILVAANAAFDVSAISPAWTNTVARTLGGNGTVTGAVVMTTGTISPGTGIGRLTFADSLTLDGTGRTTSNLFEIGTGTNDSVLVKGDLQLTGISAVRVVPTGAVINNGIHTLFKWEGNLVGDLSNLSLEYPPQTGTLTLGLNAGAREIVLQVSGVASSANLTWRGDGSANAWDLTTPNWRNGANPSVFSSGDSVTFDDTGSNNVPVDLQIAATPAGILVNATRDYVFSSSTSGRISGGGGLVKTNTGKLTLTTDNDYLGDTTVAAGTLQVGEGIGTGTLGAGSLTNGGLVIFNRGADLTLASAVRGSGILVQAGNDVLTLSGNNSQTGNTVVSNGTLRASSSAALGTGTAVLAGGTFNPQAQVNNPLNVVADSTLLGTAEISLTNVLGGTAGTLTVDNSAGNGFRFVQGTSFTFTRPIDLVSANARTIAFYNLNSTQTYSGVISGAGGLHRRAPSAGFANQDPGGHTVLTGANTFSGGVTLSEGNIGVGSSSIVDSDGITVLSGPLGTGTLTYSPPANTAAPFGYGVFYAVGAPRTIANPVTFAAVTGDTTQEPLAISGIYDLTLSGAVTLNQTAFLSGIQVNNSNTTISGAITGPGGLMKLGAGTLTLSGDNSYTAETVVTGGRLLVNNTTGSGTGSAALTVNSGGTLGGTGTIGGSATIAAGGTLAPGASIGTLSFAADLTINGNVAVEVNRTANPSNDLVVVTGTLSNGGTGTVSVNNLGPALNVGDRFVLFSKPVVNGGALTVAGGGANWANNLATDGSITVTSLLGATQPGIASTIFSGGNLIFSGTNGTAGSSFYVLSSTNVATPLSNWTRVSTNVFGAGGTFSVTNAIAPGEPLRFYLLQVP